MTLESLNSGISNPCFIYIFYSCPAFYQLPVKIISMVSIKNLLRICPIVSGNIPHLSDRFNQLTIAVTTVGFFRFVEDMRLCN